MQDYIYLYGQILTTRSYVLKGPFPKEDGSGTIDQAYFHVGGETGTAASVLASLGCKLKIGGTHMGTENADIIRTYFTEKKVDIEELVYNPQFRGVIDLVFISGNKRTSFGEWEKLYSREDAWYEPIKEESVANSICVGFDPYLDAADTRVIEYCKKYGKPYATIDCHFDSDYNRHCAINAISHQFIEEQYGENADLYEIHKRYTEKSDGLIIITCGEKEILYGRKGQEIKRFQPFQVEVKSTLGAGDSFKAGTIYGLSKQMTDDEIVCYASGVAGVACTKYPICYNPPKLEEVRELIRTNKLQ
ncbi:carbohydrate kinase family protein [[Clostridium] polysaccharolyticum]|uniref:Sugar or nucleoside kinase, ribokinase family n=1 Tax=[Clostridium] polysaccharolyticum TaxID=29364 RepID=A0A1I0AEY1_9FIRM|nr:carbohydrate kinase family protein [[Clostridium] polysaccharolyticum]SES92736.1 Sugar or nucleoside kinase, ribokinase family [[Clostridium] polysaccharolyticum]